MMRCRIRYAAAPLVRWLDWTVDSCIGWLPSWLRPVHVGIFSVITVALLPLFLTIALVRLAAYPRRAGTR